MTRIRTVDELNRLVSLALPQIRALGWDIIVHMPRSGTIPASLMSTYLNAPLASVEEFCSGIWYARRTSAGDANRILLVDDSFRTGTQMKEAIQKIMAYKPGTEIKTFAVFRTPHPETVSKLDMFLCEEPDDDYMYPWFIWKSKRIKEYAVDFDGVLCRDAIRKEDDDGPAYLNFLLTAEPKHLPTHAIGAIITARLERYRPQTEEWLNRHGVKYKKLIMGPWNSLAERKKSDVGAWKGQVFKGRPEGLFVESSLKQARVIHEVSGKSVWCTDTQEAFQAGRPGLIS